MRRKKSVLLSISLLFCGCLPAQSSNLSQQIDRWVIQPDGSIEWK
jgi:hypothetical protein